MADTLGIQAQTRTDFGKAANRRLRRLQSNIPGVVYGGENEPVSIVLNANQLKKALENEAFFSQILTLTLDGKPEKVVLKSIDRHPSRGEAIHLDFLRVSAKDKLTMNIPIHLINAEECPGVKDGGIVSHIITEVEVKCLPADLPKFISVDLANMELDQSIHLSELKLPKGVELTIFAQGLVEERDQAFVSVHIPKVAPEPEIIEEEAAAEGEAAAEEEGKAPEGEAEKGESKK